MRREPFISSELEAAGGAAQVLRRLFFALWPDGEQLQQLQVALAPRMAQVSGNVVLPDDLHLTLHFAGNANLETLEQLMSFCGGVLARSFEVKLAPLELWRSSHALVLAATGTPPSPALALQARLASEAGRLGLLGPQPTQPWRAHVTLARQVAAVPDPLEPLPEPLVWKVRRFCLAESVLSQPAGVPRYRVLGRWALI
ncbi:MAG: RNA 2',3'-cyclic phosphodiesterase [Steroidobacteraceae bacterium]